MSHPLWYIGGMNHEKTIAAAARRRYLSRVRLSGGQPSPHPLSITIHPCRRGRGTSASRKYFHFSIPSYGFKSLPSNPLRTKSKITVEISILSMDYHQLPWITTEALGGAVPRQGIKPELLLRLRVETVAFPNRPSPIPGFLRPARLKKSSKHFETFPAPKRLFKCTVIQ